jgi:hypothetical protein
MKFILRYYKRIMYFLATGCTAVFIAACYGVAAPYRMFETWTIKVKDQANKPIKGLDVKLYEFGGKESPLIFDNFKTDSLGFVEFNTKSGYQYTAHVADIDSSENGGFYSDTIVNRTDFIDSVTLRTK